MRQLGRQLDCGAGLPNNHGMRRRLTAVVLSLVIPLGSLSAPLVHAHPDAAGTDHHHAPEIHAHVGGHSSLHTAYHGAIHDGPRLDDHDAERTVSLQLFVAVAQASFDVPAAAVMTWHLGSPSEAAAHQPVRVVHGHDPPFIASTGSRAPPA